MASKLEDRDLQKLVEGEAELIKLHQHFSSFVVKNPPAEDAKLKLLEDAYKGNLLARSSLGQQFMRDQEWGGEQGVQERTAVTAGEDAKGLADDEDR